MRGVSRIFWDGTCLQTSGRVSSRHLEVLTWDSGDKLHCRLGATGVIKKEKIVSENYRRTQFQTEL